MTLDTLDPKSIISDYSCHQLHGVPCQLRPWIWEYYLQNDFDREYILDGVKIGFKIIDIPVEDIAHYETNNYVSAENEAAKPKLDKLS